MSKKKKRDFETIGLGEACNNFLFGKINLSLYLVFIKVTVSKKKEEILKLSDREQDATVSSSGRLTSLSL